MFSPGMRLLLTFLSLLGLASCRPARTSNSYSYSWSSGSSKPSSSSSSSNIYKGGSASSNTRPWNSQSGSSWSSGGSSQPILGNSRIYTSHRASIPELGLGRDLGISSSSMTGSSMRGSRGFGETVNLGTQSGQGNIEVVSASQRGHSGWSSLPSSSGPSIEIVSPGQATPNWTTLPSSIGYPPVQTLPYPARPPFQTPPSSIGYLPVQPPFQTLSYPDRSPVLPALPIHASPNWGAPSPCSSPCQSCRPWKPCAKACSSPCSKLKPWPRPLPAPLPMPRPLPAPLPMPYQPAAPLPMPAYRPAPIYQPTPMPLASPCQRAQLGPLLGPLATTGCGAGDRRGGQGGCSTGGCGK